MSRRALTSVSQAKAVDAKKVVPVPEWDADAHIFGMSGTELKEWTNGHYTTKGGRVVKTHLDTATERLLAICLRTEAGDRCFTPSDIRQLFANPGGAAIQSRLERVALELSGQDAPVDDAGDDDEDAPATHTGGGNFAEGNH